LEHKIQQRSRSYEQSASYERLSQIERDLVGTQRAIEGLTQAIQKNAESKTEAMIAKRKAFVQKLADLQAEKAMLLKQTPEKRLKDEAEQALVRYKKDIKLSQLEKEAEQINRSLAKKTTSSGISFENITSQFVCSHLIPQFTLSSVDTGSSEIHLLSRVKMGIARTELDNLVVRLDSTDPTKPVEVLAMIEAKRNANDIAEGFVMRQENLAFLCGREDRYNPDDYYTKYFRKGRFDRVASHEENGRHYYFDTSSFRHFHPSPKLNYYVDHLFFVILNRPLVGMSSSEYAKIMHRISTDVAFELRDDAYISHLLDWTRKLISPIQAHNVLQMYLQEPSWTKQIMIIFENQDDTGKRY
jgi:hypothetical protein